MIYFIRKHDAMKGSLLAIKGFIMVLPKT